MQQRILFGLVILVFFASCTVSVEKEGNKSSKDSEAGKTQTSNTKPQFDAITEQMIGVWEASSVSAQFKTVEGTDKDTFVYLPKDSMFKYLNITRNVGHYYNNFTYQEYYYGFMDSLTMQTSGTWKIENDTLKISQVSPEPFNNELHVEIIDSIGTFSGYVDWDRDGEKDDYFVAKSIKLKEKLPSKFTQQ